MNSFDPSAVADAIFEDVFGRKNTFSLEELQEKFAFDLPLPRMVTSSITNTETWTTSYGEEKIMTQDAIRDRMKIDEWMQQKKDMKDMNDVLSAWEEVNYLASEKSINSQNIVRSDNILNSSNVYQSNSIFDSKNVLFSYNNIYSSYLLGSRGSGSCTYAIRVKDSEKCSSVFEVSWSAQVSKSMFIHNSKDLYECMFCSHLISKRYCIANVQFEKEEYFRIKEMVIDWILGSNKTS